MKVKILVLGGLLASLGGCISQYVRLPSSAAQVYNNPDVEQSLLLLAQNHVMVSIPEATTREFEKTEVDPQCQSVSEPIWPEKLSIYLNEFRKRPELLSRINVIELKRGDNSGIKIQKDLDGAITVSIEFVKYESHGKVSYQSEIPCKSSVAEYLGRDLVKTAYDFPDTQKMVSALQELPEKKNIARFQFDTAFLDYLAERGTIFKFTHGMSFEKTADGKYVMGEILNRLATEVKQPFHQHMNYWFKQINQQSSQARLIQMFAAVQDKELKAGVRVDLRNESYSRQRGDADLTYLFVTYNVENDEVHLVGLGQLEKCLKNFTDEMGALRLRKPAASDRDSYLRPGYSCKVANMAAN